MCFSFQLFSKCIKVFKNFIISPVKFTHFFSGTQNSSQSRYHAAFFNHMRIFYGNERNCNVQLYLWHCKVDKCEE